MTAPKPPRLLDIEDTMVVAGTHDVHTAVRLASAGHPWFDDAGRDMPLSDVASLANKLHEMVAGARTDWYRIVQAVRGNCPCGEHHKWDVFPAEAGSRGAFRVVWWN